MINYNIQYLIRKIRTDNKPLVIFGAGKYGQMALFAFEKLGLEVDYFCDDLSIEKYLDKPVISLEKLAKLDDQTHVFLCTKYALKGIKSRLEDIGIKNIHSCVSLFKNTDFSHAYFDNLSFLEIRRRIDLYSEEIKSIQNNNSDDLDIKYIDIVITEACSMRCVSCSNLMQYYLKPRNSDTDLLFKSIDKIMAVTKDLYEFRVLGGEPFVNVEIGKIINKLSTYKNAKNIIIYSNATIIPKGENFECLKNDKILVDITNYGELSRKHQEYINLFEEHKIKYTTNVPVWTDSGTINYQKKSEDRLVEMFKNCCVNDTLTLLNGKLYRCPFSGNAMNLQAIPIEKSDYVDLLDETKTIDQAKIEIHKLYKEKKYLTACNYCNGRDFTTPKIEVAVQTKKPLPIPDIQTKS